MLVDSVYGILGDYTEGAADYDRTFNHTRKCRLLTALLRSDNPTYIVGDTLERNNQKFVIIGGGKDTEIFYDLPQEDGGLERHYQADVERLLLVLI